MQYFRILYHEIFLSDVFSKHSHEPSAGTCIHSIIRESIALTNSSHATQNYDIKINKETLTSQSNAKKVQF